MILWDGGETSLVASRRILSLTKDVVASDDDIRGSTYLVTRSWVETQVKRCLDDGTTVHITAEDISNGKPVQSRNVR